MSGAIKTGIDHLCTVFQKKIATLLFCQLLRILTDFQNSFTWLPKKTVWVALIAISTSPLLCCYATLWNSKVHNNRQTLLVQEKLICFAVSKVNKVQDMLINVWTNAVMFRVNVQCPPAAAIAPFTDCVANHFLVQTVPFLLDTLAQLFHIRDPVVLAHTLL